MADVEEWLRDRLDAVPVLDDGVERWTDLLTIMDHVLVTDDDDPVRGYAAGVSERMRHIHVRDPSLVTSMQEVRADWSSGTTAEIDCIKGAVTFDEATISIDTGWLTEKATGDRIDPEDLESVISMMQEGETKNLENILSFICAVLGEKRGAVLTYTAPSYERAKESLETVREALNVHYRIQATHDTVEVRLWASQEPFDGFEIDRFESDTDDDAVHHQQGRFLGYPEEAIEYFLNEDFTEDWDMKGDETLPDAIAREYDLDEKTKNDVNVLNAYIIPDEPDLVNEFIAKARRRREAIERYDKTHDTGLMDVYRHAVERLDADETVQTYFAREVRPVLEAELEAIDPELQVVSLMEISEIAWKSSMEVYEEAATNGVGLIPSKDIRTYLFSASVPYFFITDTDDFDRDDARTGQYLAAIDPAYHHVHVNDTAIMEAIESVRERWEKETSFYTHVAGDIDVTGLTFSGAVESD